MARIWIVAALLLLAGCGTPTTVTSSSSPCAGGEATPACQAYRYQNAY